MATASSLIREYFGYLEGLPCWQARSAYGSWLDLDFGKPEVRVRQGKPGSKLESVRRRHAYVHGEFLLWVDLGLWEYWEADRRRVHSEQRRADLRRAAARLQSQKLSKVQVVAEPVETIFTFDYGGQLRVRPAPGFESDEPLWHLYTPDR